MTYNRVLQYSFLLSPEGWYKWHYHQYQLTFNQLLLQTRGFHLSLRTIDHSFINCILGCTKINMNNYSFFTFIYTFITIAYWKSMVILLFPSKKCYFIIKYIVHSWKINRLYSYSLYSNVMRGYTFSTQAKWMAIVIYL